MKRAAIAVAALCVAVASPAAARAGEPATHVVIPVTTADPELEPLATEATAALVGALEDAGHAVEMSTAALDDVRAMLGCDGEVPCLRELAATMSADGVVMGRASSRPGGATLALTWVTEDRVYRRRFDVATDDDAAALAGRARAFVAREPFGVAPSEPAAAPAAARSRARPAPAPVVSRRRVSFRRVKRSSWAIAAGGVAGLAVGVLALDAGARRQDAIDSAPTNTVADLEALAADERAARRYNVLGSVFAVAGTATLAVGTALIVRDARSEDRELDVTISAPPGGGTGVFIGIGGSL